MIKTYFPLWSATPRENEKRAENKEVARSFVPITPREAGATLQPELPQARSTHLRSVCRVAKTFTSTLNSCILIIFFAKRHFNDSQASLLTASLFHHYTFAPIVRQTLIPLSKVEVSGFHFVEAKYCYFLAFVFCKNFQLCTRVQECAIILVRRV